MSIADSLSVPLIERADVTIPQLCARLHQLRDELTVTVNPFIRDKVEGDIRYFEGRLEDHVTRNRVGFKVIQGGKA